MPATNTTASNNTAIGVNALFTNTIGASNTAIGKDALLDNTTGFNNVALGASSLNSIANGTNNLALGTYAGNNLVSGDNNVMIGFNANLPTTTGSNQLSIMNKIKERTLVILKPDAMHRGLLGEYLAVLAIILLTTRLYSEVSVAVKHTQAQSVAVSWS